MHTTRIRIGSLAMCTILCVATREAEAVRVTVGDGSGFAGGRVEVPVTIAGEGSPAVGVQVDLFFEPNVLDISETDDCSIEPSLSVYREACSGGDSSQEPCKDFHVWRYDCRNSSECPPGLRDKHIVRARVVSFRDLNPIPDGPLFVCSFRIAEGVPAATEIVLAIRAESADGDGTLPTTVNDSAIIVVLAATPTGTPLPVAQCAGDCGGNGLVAVDELIRGVRVALGLARLDQCPSFDRNGDGAVRINELIAAVTAALFGCPATPTPTETETVTLTPGETSPTPQSPTTTRIQPTILRMRPSPRRDGSSGRAPCYSKSARAATR